MLSRVMAFLLMRLIIIFVLAFVGTSAMAAEFGASIDMTDDISAAEGLQLARPVPKPPPDDDPPDLTIKVTVIFERAVVLRVNDVKVGGFDENDDYIPEVGLAEMDPIAPITASKEITLTITITEATVKVGIKTADDIESANPLNDDTSEVLEAEILLLAPDTEAPTVYSIERVGSLFSEVVSETVQVIITLSEQPKAFTKDHVSVSNAIHGDPVALVPHAAAGNTPSTGRDAKLYPYVLTLTPTYPTGKPNIVVQVKAFEDLSYPKPKWYIPPRTEAAYTEGIEKLTLKVGKEILPRLTAGSKLHLPEAVVIPGRGYLVVAKEKAGSAVRVPLGDIAKAPTAHERTPAELRYNVIDDGDLPNLETFFSGGGVMDVVSPHALVVSEVMWGSDASLDDPSKSQWIELYNTGAAYTTAYESVRLVFYASFGYVISYF